MFGGLNWIDALVILLLIGVAFSAYRLGVVTELCIVASTYVALFFFGWLWPRLLPISDPTLETIMTANLVLISVGYAGIKGFELGRKLHWAFARPWWQRVEGWLAIAPGMLAALLGVWLIAAFIGWLPFAALSNSVNDAQIVQLLHRNLPPVPAVLTPISRQVDPNTPSAPALQPEPQDSFAYSSEQVAAASARAVDSVVRLTAFGCGGLSSGTGFVVGKNLVMTNAHVVAGVRRPIVKYDNHSYEARPVFFDAVLDVAVLRVLIDEHRFAAPALKLVPRAVAPDTTIAVAGYPSSSYSVVPGIIRSDLRANRQTIYGFRASDSSTYQVQTSVSAGNSGSPLVLADGQVAGMVYAKYDAVPDYAAAVASHHLVTIVQKAQDAYLQVGTGACIGS
jgi:S1-C subfamily serine protease